MVLAQKHSIRRVRLVTQTVFYPIGCLSFPCRVLAIHPTESKAHWKHINESGLVLQL